jgi:hypothetical protein
MADNATLEFLGAQLERVLAELRAVRADQAESRDDIRVLAAIVPRHENTPNDMLEPIRAMVARQARFNDRLRRLEQEMTP